MTYSDDLIGDLHEVLKCFQHKFAPYFLILDSSSQNIDLT